MNTFWDPIENTIDKYSVSLEKFIQDNQAKLQQKPGITWLEGSKFIPTNLKKQAELLVEKNLKDNRFNEKQIVRDYSPVSAEAIVIIEVVKQNSWGYRPFASQNRSNTFYEIMNQDKLGINLSNEIWGSLNANGQLFDFYSSTSPSNKRFARIKRDNAEFVNISQKSSERKRGFWKEITKAIMENPPISFDIGIGSDQSSGNFFPKQRIYIFNISPYSKSDAEFLLEPENFLLKHFRDIELESNDFNKMFHISTPNKNSDKNIFEVLNPSSMAILIDWTKEMGLFEMIYNSEYVIILSSEGWGNIKHKIIKNEFPHQYNVILEEGEAQRVKDIITKNLKYSMKFLSSLDFI